jgi:hypothetical protein
MTGSAPRARLYVIQLAGAWACGSVLLGTLALLVTAAIGVGGPTGRAAFDLPAATALAAFTPVQRLAAVGLVVALFVALGVLGWRTAAATWLDGDARTRLLWVLVTGGGGLAGWAYAAGITYAAGFTPGAQILLAYLGGGLPFALVAGMLQRPWRVNVAAAGLSAALVAAGFLMVAWHPVVSPQLALFTG